jgi:hypothetical protein
MKQYIFILTATVLLLLTACNNDEQCRKETYLRFYAGFYHATVNSTTKAVSESTVSLAKLSVTGIGSDSILYSDTTVASLILPLNKLKGESVYKITKDTISDTIRIFHTNYNTYLSLECGSIKTFKIDTVLFTKHFIDSIKISERNVNTSTSAKQNIKIYN